MSTMNDVATRIYLLGESGTGQNIDLHGRQLQWLVLFVNSVTRTFIVSFLYLWTILVSYY